MLTLSFRAQTALGPQMLSTLPSSPVSGFGTAKRPSMATKSGVPGPGAYKLKNTVGKACPVCCADTQGKPSSALSFFVSIPSCIFLSSCLPFLSRLASLLCSFFHCWSTLKIKHKSARTYSCRCSTDSRGSHPLNTHASNRQKCLTKLVAVVSHLVDSAWLQLCCF